MCKSTISKLWTCRSITTTILCHWSFPSTWATMRSEIRSIGRLQTNVTCARSGSILTSSGISKQDFRTRFKIPSWRRCLMRWFSTPRKGYKSWKRTAHFPKTMPEPSFPELLQTGSPDACCRSISFAHTLRARAMCFKNKTGGSSTQNKSRPSGDKFLRKAGNIKEMRHKW